jgi:quinol-cytochrome oxidoreductase complex cytochrome b subunit
MSKAPMVPGDTPEAAPARKDAIAWLEERLNLTELFSFITHFGIIYTPIDTQRPLREQWKKIVETPMVSYARWPHILGLLTALLFGLEAFTGVLLAFYHQPTIAGAYDSTRSIVRDVPLGWLVHQVHAWGSSLLVLVVLIRMVRLFWDGLYRAPREVLWLSAVALAWIVLQLDFTGLLLPWDVKSYWSAVRGLEIVWAIPFVGPFLSFLVGGRTMSEDVMARFYVLHIIVLPALYLAFVYVTFATMRRVGLSRVTDKGVVQAQTMTTFRRHIADLLIITLVLFAGLVTLATLLPFPFHGAADPYTTPKGTRPPWYMLAPYALFQVPWIPDWVFGFVLLVVAVCIPFLPALLRVLGERIDEPRLKRIGLGVLGLWLVLSVIGIFVDRR